MKPMFVVLLALFLGSVPANAQSAKPNMFSNREACRAAVLSGNYSSYKPRNFNLKGKKPVAGSTIDSVQIERPMCYNLLTFDGWQWTSFETGTWMLTCNGRICGLAECWNPGREYFYPEADAPVTHSLGAPSPAAARFTPPPPVHVTQTQTTTVTIEKDDGGGNGWKWLVAGAVVVTGAALIANALSDDDDTKIVVIEQPPRTCENTNAVNYGGTLPCRFPPGTDTDSVRVGPGTTTDSVVVGELPTCNGLCGGIRTSRIAAKPALVSSRSGASLSPIIDVRRMRATFVVSIPTETVWGLIKSIAP